MTSIPIITILYLLFSFCSKRTIHQHGSTHNDSKRRQQTKQQYERLKPQKKRRKHIFIVVLLAIPSLLFLYFCLFFEVYLKQLVVNKISDNWNGTADLWCRKWPLQQLYHNCCPVLYNFGASSYFSFYHLIGIISGQ